MKDIKTKPIILLFLFGLLLLIVFSLPHQPDEDTSNISQNSYGTSYNAIGHGNSKNENTGIYRSTNMVEDYRCEECHDEFTPFEVRPELPENVNEGEVFTFEIEVTNSHGEPKHTVENLEATLTGIGERPEESYHNELGGSLRRFQSDTTIFPVENYASEVIVTLTGDSGIGRRNDLDLLLTSPTGKTWSSASSGVEEEIYLDSAEIASGSYGDYTLEIQYLGGIGPISYSLIIDVTYIMPELIKSGGDLEKGGSHTFSWDLSLISEEIENLGSEVSGTVAYAHADGFTVSHR
ncbi:MAG: hypothetical protein JSV49_08170 [Thermoplasmata archaeon]|nr:MAG: hypothetical protein JSV49_08170 [Thermoplasmata archaeon]